LKLVLVFPASGLSKGKKTFCWRRFSYAPNVPDPSHCPQTFHPGMGSAEIPHAATTDKPFVCKKPCSEICGLGGREHFHFWCKCKVQVLPANIKSHLHIPDEVVLGRYAWPKRSTCNDAPFLNRWGHSCYATCPEGRKAILGRKNLPVCDTDCHSQLVFNTSCALGCAKSKEDCADDTEAIIVHTAETVLDIAAIATGQLEAIPVIHTLTSLIDALYRLIKMLVKGFMSEWETIHKMTFSAAVAQMLHDLVAHAKELKKDEEDLQQLVKDAYKLIIQLGHDAGKKVSFMTAVKNIFEKFHLATIMSVYELFKDLYNPLCEDPTSDSNATK